MNKRLFVGNLPYQVEETHLQDLFSQAGSVESVRVMRDVETGRADKRQAALSATGPTPGTGEQTANPGGENPSGFPDRQRAGTGRAADRTNTATDAIPNAT